MDDTGSQYSNDSKHQEAVEDYEMNLLDYLEGNFQISPHDTAYNPKGRVPRALPVGIYS